MINQPVHVPGWRHRCIARTPGLGLIEVTGRQGWGGIVGFCCCSAVVGVDLLANVLCKLLHLMYVAFVGSRGETGRDVRQGVTVGTLSADL